LKVTSRFLLILKRVSFFIDENELLSPGRDALSDRWAELFIEVPGVS
jgi:hypothetical protein